MRLELLIIDPQYDFCNPNGALFVPGAEEDSKRLAEMIKRLGKRIDDIHCTLDTHRTYHIAHPCMWVDSNGNHPDPVSARTKKPGTIITKDDALNGKWRTVIDSSRGIKYVTKLDENDRYPLCIWEPHCIIGSDGHTIISSIFKAFTEWEHKCIATVDHVTKGSNTWSEHYSAVQADVPDPDDPSTFLNTDLIELLKNDEITAIGLSGQALSHCVANTVSDIADNFGEENIKKLVLIEDTTSSVPGFEHLGEEFVKKMTKRGMQMCKAADFFA